MDTRRHGTARVAVRADHTKLIPFIHLHYHIYTYVHFVTIGIHVYTPYIHLKTPHIHPYVHHYIHPNTCTVWYALCVEGTAPHRSTRVAVLGAAIEGGRQGDRSGDQWGTGCATKQLLVRVNRVNQRVSKESTDE
jgi:hypothetical protein